MEASLEEFISCHVAVLCLFKARQQVRQVIIRDIGTQTVIQKPQFRHTQHGRGACAQVTVSGSGSGVRFDGGGLTSNGAEGVNNNGLLSSRDLTAATFHWAAQTAGAAAVRSATGQACLIWVIIELERVDGQLELCIFSLNLFERFHVG